jgi:hypothetical protein
VNINEATAALEKLGFENVEIDKVGWVHRIQATLFGRKFAGADQVLDVVFAKVADDGVRFEAQVWNAANFNPAGAYAIDAPRSIDEALSRDDAGAAAQRVFEQGAAERDRASGAADNGPRTTEPPPATRQSALTEGDGSLVTELAGDNGGGDNGGGENAGDNGEGGGDAEGGGK